MVVIIGAGIVGAATAYYLSASSANIQVLDAVGPATGSSGRAGAFVTNSPPCSSSREANDKRLSLFEASFGLHEQLARDLSLNSFCRVKSTTRNNDSTGILAVSGDAALVDPAELTTSLLDRSLSKKNCSFRQANVVGLETDLSGRRVTAIHLENKDDEEKTTISNPKCIATEENEPVVIALGPWSCRIEDWLGIPMPIEGIVSTSLIYENSIPPSEVGTALFFEEDSNGCHLEVFGRHDQSMYVSGCGESQVIGTRALRSKDCPAPGHCSPNTARATAAQKSLKRTGFFSGKHIDMKPNSIQACMRPTSPDGVPIVGRILDNVYVATGGGPWGITWGPLMGKCLASLINEDDDLPIRLAPLSHQRFDTLIYKSLLKSRAPDDT